MDEGVGLGREDFMVAKVRPAGFCLVRVSNWAEIGARDLRFWPGSHARGLH